MKKMIFLTLIFCVHSAVASVIMVGTRVIVSSEANEKTVQFNNPDLQPYIVEMKVDDRENAPFVVVPPVFRIEPHQGQTVRLISTPSAKTLPRDRESVFYLNFVQIPSIKASDRLTNQLIIAVNSRVKVFYRPDSLAGQQSNAFKSLRFTLADGKILVQNPTGFHISVSRARFVNSHQSTLLTNAVMLAPFSSTELSPAGKITSLRGGKVLLTQVNDYGAYIEDEKDL